MTTSTIAKQGRKLFVYDCKDTIQSGVGKSLQHPSSKAVVGMISNVLCYFK